MTKAAAKTQQPVAVPPNLQAEQGLLSIVLGDNGAIALVADQLRAEHFAEPFHQVIYTACQQLVSEGLGANPVTLRSRIETHPTYAEAGGDAYLARLAALGIPANSAGGYARAILENHARRSLVATAEKVIAEATTGSTRLLDVANLAATRSASVVETLAGTTARRTRHTFAQAVAAAIDLAAEAYQNEGVPRGAVMTGIGALDRHIGGFLPGDLVIIAGRPGMGKAQPLTAKVRTVSGWKKMGDLRLGDELTSLDGARSIVSAVYPQGQKKVYRILFSDGRETRCCGEHLWRVHYRHWDVPRVINTQEIIRLLSRKRYRHRLWIDLAPSHHQDDKQTEQLPIDPWVLGALLGDGSFARDSVRFSSAEEEMVSRLDCLVGDGVTVVSGGSHPYNYRVRGKTRRNQNHVLFAARHLGLDTTRSHSKFVPHQYLDAGYYVRLRLLQGLMDTDGWVEKHGTVRISVVSPRLAADIQELARSVGAWAKVATKDSHYLKHGERVSCRLAYTVTICHPNPACLFTLTAKKARCKPQTVRKMPVIVSVEPDGVEECQCISVTHGSRLYFTDDYVLTHNTAVAGHIAFSAATSGKPSHVLSLEMYAPQLTVRQISAAMPHPKVPYNRIMKGRFSEAEFHSIVDTTRRIMDTPMGISDPGRIPLAAVEAEITRIKTENPAVALFVVDYLQLVKTGEGSGHKSRAEEIGDITATLKGLASRLGVVMVVLSQLSRAVEAREDKRPQMSDLRESGAIEQDADIILFPFREEYYLARNEPKPNTTEHIEWQDKMNAITGTMELIIAKFRMGSPATVRCRADMATNSIEDMPEDRQPEMF